MGNRSGTDDGWNYRGRGLIQITGRDGYARVGAIAGLDLVGNPSLANEQHNLLLVAASFWTWKGLNKVVDRGLDDAALVAATRIINGGTNGLADRRAWFSKWKRELGL
jgi:putative chitinase